MSKLNIQRVLLPSQIETEKLHMYMQITPLEGRSAPTVQVNIPEQTGRAADLRELAETLNEIAALLEEQETGQPSQTLLDEKVKEEDIAHTCTTQNFHATVALNPLGKGTFDVQFGKFAPSSQRVAQADLYELGRFFYAVADEMKG